MKAGYDLLMKFIVIGDTSKSDHVPRGKCGGRVPAESARREWCFDSSTRTGLLGAGRPAS